MSKKKHKQTLPVAVSEQMPVSVVVEDESVICEIEPEIPTAETVQSPLREVKRVPLTHRTWAKVLVFILTILFAAVTVLSAVGIVVLVEQNIYTTPKSEYRATVFNNLAEGVAYEVLSLVINEQEGRVEEYLRHENAVGVSILAKGSRAFTWQCGATVENENVTVCESKWLWYSNNEIRLATLNSNRWMDTVYVSVYIPAELTQQDDFMLMDYAVDAAYALMYWVYAIAAAAFLLTVLCFVFLVCASGRRKGLDRPQPGWGTRIPFDVLTAAFFVAIFLLAQVAVEAFYFASIVKQVVAWSVCGVLAAVLLLGWCMSAALRWKLGRWWECTVTFWALSHAVRFLKWAGGHMGKLLSRCGTVGMMVLGTVPLVWKTAAVFLLIAFVDLIFVMGFRRDVDMLLVTWLLLRMAVFAGVIYIALCLRRLQKGGEALAAGDLSYQVDTEKMLPTFKAYAEDLSRIGEGMTAAVEQRLKSERMKTELITNVSHDIKTPLTSIINYSDLIGKEPCENEKITEYAEVLHRQSERLKRLIDDLVEASKASTGNLDVQLAPCEVGVMLSQAMGEYEQRMEQCGLALVTRQPEEAVRIMADGRRLWRVFDNLLNNICKYAMPGTRVYLTLEKTGGQAVISFKNTSREPLDLSSDELMERFVRGDAARNSEGNGLGLSIARSLVQLQKGTLELTVDGDLFKAVLRFPVM